MGKKADRINGASSVSCICTTVKQEGVGGIRNNCPTDKAARRHHAFVLAASFGGVSGYTHLGGWLGMERILCIRTDNSIRSTILQLVNYFENLNSSRQHPR